MSSPPSASTHPAGSTGWVVAPPVRLPPRVRWIGFVVGLAVALLFAIGVVAFDVLSRGSPLAATVIPPLLIAGACGGWLLAPTAWRSRRRRDWVVAAVLLALAAVAIGDAVVVTGLALTNPPSTGGWFGTTSGDIGTWASPLSVLPGLIGIFFLGLLVVGWFVLPFALAASAIWAAVMCAIRGRLTRLAR